MLFIERRGWASIWGCPPTRCLVSPCKIHNPMHLSQPNLPWLPWRPLTQVFSVYECRSAAAQHGKAHPGDIAEPASLAAIPLPPR